METTVTAVIPGSPASRTCVRAGDTLKKINGHVISDVLDYRFYVHDRLLLLELIGAQGGMKLVRLRKSEDSDPGLVFTSPLMDSERSCANKCVFCFIDQLPKGMRNTLYYKDDDVRLSFLQGNYITLTNLTPREIERIISLRISPINVSVHTLNPSLRDYMLGSKRGGESLKALYAFAGSGLTLNCQIVVCPGVNDGAELLRTMAGLAELFPAVNSVSVVPVGLTRHRDGLASLRPFDRTLAEKTIWQVDGFGARCQRRYGSRLFYCADELYIKAGLKLPPDGYYEGYPQLENGVGMMRLLITEFCAEMARTPRTARVPEPFSVATGSAAGKYLTKLLKSASEKYGIVSESGHNQGNCRRCPPGASGNINTLHGTVYTVRNRFFGEGVTVAGLVTGGDIIRRLSGRDLGSRLLIPANMLRTGENVFLDDVTVPELSNSLGIPVRIVVRDGADLLRAFLGG